MAESYRKITCYWCGVDLELDFAAEFCGDHTDPKDRDSLTHHNFIAGGLNLRDEVRLLAKDFQSLSGDELKSRIRDLLNVSEHVVPARGEETWRADFGEEFCEDCQKLYKRHLFDIRFVDYYGCFWLRKLCNGDLVKV